MPLQHMTTTISNHHIWDSFLTSCRNGQTDASNYHSQWDSNEAFNSFLPFFKSYNNPVHLTKQKCKETQNNPLQLSSIEDQEKADHALLKPNRHELQLIRKKTTQNKTRLGPRSTMWVSAEGMRVKLKSDASLKEKWETERPSDCSYIRTNYFQGDHKEVLWPLRNNIP